MSTSIPTGEVVDSRRHATVEQAAGDVCAGPVARLLPGSTRLRGCRFGRPALRGHVVHGDRGVPVGLQRSGRHRRGGGPREGRVHVYAELPGRGRAGPVALGAFILGPPTCVSRGPAARRWRLRSALRGRPRAGTWSPSAATTAGTTGIWPPTARRSPAATRFKNTSCRACRPRRADATGRHGLAVQL